MKNIYFTPGPSQLFATVRQHILDAVEEDIPSLSHRSEKFHAIVKDTYDGLRQLLNIPQNYHIFFVASATEAMEKIIENTVSEHSFHFVNGAFSKRFYQTALDLKKKPTVMQQQPGEIFDFSTIEIPQETELIAFTHNETSGGTAIPLQYMYAVRKKYPQALIAVDIVSSIPHVDLDYTQFDSVFFSVQKGFGLPAGLGVMIISPRALEKGLTLQREGLSVGSYHKFENLYKNAQKYQTIETPNVLGIYLFRKVLKDMLNIGVANIRKDTEDKAARLYSFFDGHSSLHPLLPKDKKEWRSQTVIVIATPEGSTPILKNLREKGLIVGSGYGDQKEKQMRIANFPAITQKHIEDLLKQF